MSSQLAMGSSTLQVDSNIDKLSPYFRIHSNSSATDSQPCKDILSGKKKKNTFTRHRISNADRTGSKPCEHLIRDCSILRMNIFLKSLAIIFIMTNELMLVVLYFTLLHNIFIMTDKLLLVEN